MNRNYILCVVLALAAGCANDGTRPRDLQAENDLLRANLEGLRASLSDMTPEDLQTMPRFTVGLAASEIEFDYAEFEKLLQDSLRAAARDQSVRVTRETDEREVAKVRGMLMQQYLAAAELPVRISNLSFKLQDSKNEFKIGGSIVPRSEIEVSQADDSTVRAIHREAIPAVMQRDSQGRYHIPYEELGGGGGRILVQTSDAEILDTGNLQHSQRQGDISFSWALDLKQVEVYGVEGFRGDVGLFLSNMRYSGVQSPMAKYQTMRDAVLLFGYGRYVTSVISQIRTPAHIAQVEVAAIDPQAFDNLSDRLTEQQVITLAGTARWEPCEFVDFDDQEKVWARPATVPFPFISRQVSEEEQVAFYLKYSSEGVFFIGEYER